MNNPGLTYLQACKIMPLLDRNIFMQFGRSTMDEHPLKILVLYHSASGNTAWVAEQLAAHLPSAVTLRSITEHQAGADLQDFSMVGFGCPVMAFQPSLPMTDFIRNLPAQQGMPAFIFTTYAGIHANSSRVLAELLASRGFTTVWHERFRCEESWPVLRYTRCIMGRGRPGNPDMPRIIACAQAVAERARSCARGRAAAPVRTPFNPFDVFYYIGRIVRRDALRMMMGAKKIAADKCTQCGLCRDWCAAGAISLDPRPVFSSRCIGCWGCYNICPEGALQTFIPHSGRYHAQASVLKRLRRTNT
jgi:Pyruvate/2-oxoacid:ferredoxin oxidoreductase delta subunit/flavodoxin